VVITEGGPSGGSSSEAAAINDAGRVVGWASDPAGTLHGFCLDSRLAVVVDADVGAGLVGKVGSATPGTRRGGSGCGNRVAEATRAARIAVASPKVNK